MTYPRNGRRRNSFISRLLLVLSIIAAIVVLALLQRSGSFIPSSRALSSTVVISQVYGGAGCGTAGCSTYKNDYIELFNRGASPVSLNGWSVQYAAATGTSWQVTNLTNVMLQPGQYYLVGEGAGANGVNNIPTADATGTIPMSATAAKVALVNTTTALTGQCGNGATLTLPASVVDFIGYGTTANCNESGTSASGNAPAPSTTTADVRGTGGCTETDNNSADFTATTPNPRNTSSTFNACGVSLPNLTVTDVSQSETNGATTFTFQVNLSAPAGPGGVTFDIATADGTAQDDNPAVSEDNDYVGQSLTGQTIAAGNSSFAFNVTVNGDVIPETNETFFVNVTNVTGATVTDGQGQGTIQNDDASCANLSINDVTQNEGNAGTTTFAFTVSLSQAGCGTVTFDIATADGTAQDDNPPAEDNDYVPQSLTGQTITFPSTYTFNVTVNGDLTTEPDQTFFVNITNVSPGNVTVSDAQGLGTITNDDYTRIHDIQGNGNTSPIVGTSVTTRGIVTGRKTNGYFIQDPTPDADPNTSEGMFVFTNSAPSGSIQIGDLVSVTGTVAEFIAASSDEPVSLAEPKTATELTSPTTTILSSGNPLPAPVTEAILNPVAASRSAQLEKYEYMRVSISSLTVTQPTNNNFGEFWGVTTGTLRPFREPGIESGDPIPLADEGPFAGSTPPNVPIFDGNFERILIDSDDSTNTSNTRRSALFVTTGAVVTGIVGPLDYAFDDYRIVLDFNVVASVTPGITAAIPAPTPTAGEFTISHANLENFSSGNATKLNKASLAIRNVLRTPDVVGLIEVDTTASATALANKINADFGNPSVVNYVAYFNDTGASQDIGYLVNSARVTVVGSPTPYHPATTFTYCGITDTLHDRPAYVLNVTFPQPGGGNVPVTVILNHTKSLIAVDSQAPYGSCGTGTEGARNREKRRQQAEDIADLIQLHIAENLVVLGDLNAFDFNDGLQDMVGTLKGTPAPANQVVEPSTDDWTYTLTNLINTLPADQRYSFAFEGNAQALDHVLVNSLLLQRNTRFAYGRYNGDFSNDYAANSSTPERVADHDAPVAYFYLSQANVSITKTLDTAGPYTVGQSVTYTLNVANAGPDTATNIQVTDTPTNLTITNVSGSGCAALPCTISSLAAGANTSITVTATLDAPGAFDNSASATAAEADPDSANNTDNTGNGGTTGASADVSLTKTLDTSGPYFAGGSVTYTLNVSNGGPSTATNIQVTDTPTNLTITNVSGACASLPCTITSLASGANTNITVTATINGAGAFDNSATATGAEFDANSANNTDNTGNGGTTSATADVSLTKSLDTAGPYYAGSSVTYTIGVANAGPDTATNIQVTDTPTNLTITNVTGSGCTSLPCTITSLAATGNTTITVTATIDAVGAFDNSATATATEFDSNTADNTDNTGNGGTAVLPTLSIDDVTHFEGNSGTTSYIFTVTKTGAGAATVQFTTNNGTGTLANNDYQANSNTLSFLSSDTTKQITVLVNGDTTPEANETFTVDLSSPSGATITDGSGLGVINNDDESASAGQVIISEFRFRGPGFIGGPPAPPMQSLKGVKTPVLIGPTNQAQDEFIEIYNNSNSDVTVLTTDGSAGWAVVGADGVTRFIIPNNTVIPARGHFLGVNTVGYSLTNYGGPNAGAGDTVLLADGVTPASGYTLDIPDGSGVALFRSANPANFTLAERLDAAGYAGVDSLYREGTGFPTGGAETTSNLEYTFFRSMTRTTGGLPKDTGDNTADFFLADTAGTDFDLGAGTIQRLGAPGPENLSSPINRTAQFGYSLLDTGVSAGSMPNRERSATVVPNGDFGTLTIRRTFTNNTGGTLSRLRFRIVEVTTFPSPTGSGLADLRALSSSDEPITLSNSSIVVVRGTTLEQPPTQSIGGGWNATLNVPNISSPPIVTTTDKVLRDTPTTGTIVLAAPLNNGESVSVQFKLGVMKTGLFYFYLNIEAGQGCPPLVLLPCEVPARQN